MLADDSFSHRGVSAIRNGRRFAPYQALPQTPLKPYASCPAILSFSQTFSTAPDKYDQSNIQPNSQSTAAGDAETSSVITPVNSTFPERCETKWDSPAPSIFSDKPLKTVEKVAKFQKRQLLHQRKADYVVILIGMLSVFSCYVYSNDNLSLQIVYTIVSMKFGVPAKFQLRSAINAAQRLGTRKRQMHSTSNLRMARKCRNRLDSSKEICPCPRAITQIKVNLQHTSNRNWLH